MNVTFDPAKDALNLVNHHMTLGLAEELDWETLQVKPDSRHDYGEVRMVGTRSWTRVCIAWCL